MPLSRRNLLTLLLTAAIPGLPAAVCAQLPDPALRKTESSEDTSYPAMPEVQAYIEETTKPLGRRRTAMAFRVTS